MKQQSVAPIDLLEDPTAGIKRDHYGQLHPIENDELIRYKMTSFDEAINAQFDETNMDGVRQAMKMCPNLLTFKFKLAFLRVAVYKIDLAVQTYRKYWKKRIELFGDRAFQPLNIDCLSPEAIDALRTGYLKPVDGTYDEKGRAFILIDVSKRDPSISHSAYACMMWYIFHTLLDKESVQKHGTLWLIDMSNASYSDWDRQYFKTLAKSLVGVIPSRCASLQLIRPPTFVAKILPIGKMFLTDILRKRVHCMTGNDDKLMALYDKKFGIPMECLPKEIGGTVDIKFEGWFEKQFQRQSEF